MKTNDKILISVMTVVVVLFVAAAGMIFFTSSDEPYTSPEIPDKTSAAETPPEPPKTAAAGTPTPPPVNTAVEIKQIPGLGRISGKVTDVAGSPLKDAVITVRSPVKSNESKPRAVSGGDGGYMLKNVPPNRFYVLDIEKEGYCPMTLTRINVEKGKTTRNVDFILTTGGSLTVTVRDNSGNPVEGVKVNLANKLFRPPGKHGPDSRRFFYGTTDISGKALFQAIPEGDYRCTFSHPDYLQYRKETSANIRKGDSKEIEIILQRGAKVSGRVVTDSGNPVEGAYIRLSWNPDASSGPRKDRHIYTDHTDKDGRFTCRGVSKGDYLISARSGNHLASDNINLSVTGGDDLTVPDIIVPEGETISGRITDGSGKPIAGVRVMAKKSDWYKHAFSTADGSYRIKGLKQGKYVVSIYSRKSPNVLPRMNVATGSTGVDFSVEKPSQISGRLAGDYPALQRYKVAVFMEDPELVERGREPRAVKRRMLRYGGENRFTIRDIPPGTFWVAAETAGYERGRAVRVTVGSDGDSEGIELFLGDKKVPKTK